MSKKLKRWIFIPLGTVLALIVGIVIFVKVASKPLPKGVEGAKAEEMADKMLEAVNTEAWEDLNWVAWTFPGGRKYVWDKEGEYVEISWEDNVVLQNLDTGKGVAYTGGEALEESDRDEMLTSSLQMFWNDSFWLSGFNKVKDEGTKREYVEMEDGTPALLVTYMTGGVTPGDSYLWILDEEGRPKAWQMWVEILPIGGIDVTWDNWIELEGGAKVASLHKAGPVDLEITGIESGDTWSDLGLSADPFVEIRL